LTTELNSLHSRVLSSQHSAELWLRATIIQPQHDQFDTLKAPGKQGLRCCFQSVPEYTGTLDVSFPTMENAKVYSTASQAPAFPVPSKWAKQPSSSSDALPPFPSDSPSSFYPALFSPPSDLFFVDPSLIYPMSLTPQNTVFHDIPNTPVSPNGTSTTSSPPPITSHLEPSGTPPARAPPVAIDRVTKRLKCPQCHMHFAQAKQLRQVPLPPLTTNLVYKLLQPLPQSRNIPNCP
jgi:hypothetical protein